MRKLQTMLDKIVPHGQNCPIIINKKYHIEGVEWEYVT